MVHVFKVESTADYFGRIFDEQERWLKYINLVIQSNGSKLTYMFQKPVYISHV